MQTEETIATRERETSGSRAAVERAALAADSAAALAAPEERGFRFGRMFPELADRAFRPDDEALIELGHAMHDSPDAGEHPSLTAGYAFLAQFIAHDITFDLTGDIPEGNIDLQDIKQGRSPFLDLENLYGKGPASEDVALYKGDFMKVGPTKPDLIGDAYRSYENDLPRAEDAPGRALIGDARDDENLGVAQMHVAFLKFHNSVARRLQADVREGLFEEVRKKVIRHYQWIILHEFLPRIVEAPVLKRYLSADEPPKRLTAEAFEHPFMPIEFSAAAFRLGHSTLRDLYEWNRVYQSPPGGVYADVARLSDLMKQTGERGRLTGLNGDDNLPSTLPSNWIIDWTRFFDFTGHNGIATNPKLNFSGKIDSSLTPTLNSLEQFLTHITRSKFRSLAVLDLVRGQRVGLPTGQDVAASLEVPALAPSDFATGRQASIVGRHRFDKKTPLWFYILKEAEVVHGGRRLGTVGSTIVVETLVELIRRSPHSILENGSRWKPDLGQIDRDVFQMADLLVMANVVNPLGA